MVEAHRFIYAQVAALIYGFCSSILPAALTIFSLGSKVEAV